MNTLILKDERGAVETVPSYEGIATRFDRLFCSRACIFVETVPSYEGIATAIFSSIVITPYWLKLSRVMRALRPYYEPPRQIYHLGRVETVPSYEGIATYVNLKVAQSLCKSR